MISSGNMSSMMETLGGLVDVGLLSGGKIAGGGRKVVIKPKGKEKEAEAIEPCRSRRLLTRYELQAMSYLIRLSGEHIIGCHGQTACLGLYECPESTVDAPVRVIRVQNGPLKKQSSCR